MFDTCGAELDGGSWHWMLVLLVADGTTVGRSW